MHGIQIKHPWLLLIICLVVDIIKVEVFEWSDTWIIEYVAPFIISAWLVGFIWPEWRASKQETTREVTK